MQAKTHRIPNASPTTEDSRVTAVSAASAASSASRFAIRSNVDWPALSGGNETSSGLGTGDAAERDDSVARLLFEPSAPAQAGNPWPIGSLPGGWRRKRSVGHHTPGMRRSVRVW